MALGIFARPEFNELPHPAIRLPVLLLVETAICAAWDILRARPRAGFDISTAAEDEITFELQETLVDQVFNSGIVAGFDDGLFSIPEREAKIRSFDYAHLDKMPDLIIRLIGRPPGIRRTQDGLFVECKPVDKKHRLHDHYCNKGILRFTAGQYAWAMSTALMVGYTNADYKISVSLPAALEDWPEVATRTPVQLCSRSIPTATSEPTHITKHARRFKYQETGAQAPEIVLRHLWLRRD